MTRSLQNRFTKVVAMSASRRDAWEKRHEGFAETGRDRALLMLSVAITAVLLYVRLS